MSLSGLSLRSFSQVFLLGLPLRPSSQVFLSGLSLRFSLRSLLALSHSSLTLLSRTDGAKILRLVQFDVLIMIAFRFLRFLRPRPCLVSGAS